VSGKAARSIGAWAEAATSALTVAETATSTIKASFLMPSP
jgi:hypothetical protein